MKKVFNIFLISRLLLFIPIIVGMYILPVRHGYEYTQFLDYLNYHKVPTYLIPPVFAAFANFDGVHYITISHYGYTINAGFFPLLPLLIRVSSNILFFLPIDISLFWTGLILCNVFFFCGLLIFYKLLKLDYTNLDADKTILFFLLFPTTFFFSLIYSESLFFLLLITSFYFARKKKWMLAASAAGLLSATRIVGVALLPALIYEFWIQEKHTVENLKHKIFFGVTILKITILSLFGLILYIVFNFLKWHDAFFFIHAQESFKNNRSTFVLFPQAVVRYVKILTTVSSHQFEWWTALIELAAFCIAISLLFLGWRTKIRMSYLIFALFALLIPISTGTFTGLPRYILVLFPLFIGLACIKNKLLLLIYGFISLPLLFILFMIFSRGFFIA